MASNPLKSLAGQTMVYGMGTIVPRLLNYLLVPYYTRVFEQGVYGQITELFAYVAFLLVLLTFGMETAFFRFAQKHDLHKVFNNIFSLIIVTTGIFILVISVSFGALAGLIQYSGNSEYVLFIGLIVALDAATAVPFALLRKQNMARKFAMIKLVNVVVNVSLNLLFLTVFPKYSLQLAIDLFGPGSTLLVWVFIINLISSALSFIMLLPQMKKFTWELDLIFLKPIIFYALPVLIVGIAGMVNEVIDKILLKYLLPDSSTAMIQLGVYGANYKLGVLMTLFIQMFRYAAEPFFFAQADKADSKVLFARVMNYFIIFGLMIFLMVTLYLDVFKLLIGKSYREGLTIVPIVLMANLFYGIFFNLSIWYKLTDRTGDAAYVSIGGAVITIILNIILIPFIGFLGAAWAHLACYTFMMIVSYSWGNKVYPIPYQLSRIGSYIASALLIYFISYWLTPANPLIRYAVNTVLFLLFIGTTLFIEKKYQLSTS
ncbi:MAG: oligosaccharide flippase family protein [Bacteroidales bacterium]|nr:oligosaccharide flippase family protein [Bacteroidales bacterium]